MSKMMYVKAPAPKREEEVVVTMPLTTHHNTLMITIAIIVGSSLLIGIGFAYMGHAQVIIQMNMGSVKMTFYHMKGWEHINLWMKLWQH